MLIERNTAAGWTSSNPVLSYAAIGYCTSNGKIKVGDGSTAWDSLSYVTADAAAAWGAISGTLSSQTDLQTALNLKAPLANPTFTGTINGITKAMIGLGNVPDLDTATTANVTDSTNKRFCTDAEKTVIGNTSGTNTGDQNLSSLAPLASPTFTGTVSGVTKAMVGLGSVTDADTSTTANITDSTNKRFCTDAEKTAIGTIAPPVGYAINVQALTSSPTDGQTVYFGMLPKAPTTTANISKCYVRKTCTIQTAEIYCYSGTAGTNEAWSLYIRKNNTTDTLIATVSAATNERVFSNAALSIAMVSGDYFELKSVQPTFATNPLTTIWAGYLYML